jgi:NADPH:quinone reductase
VRSVHAIRQYEFGPAENLRYEEVDDPRPRPGQVRIAVAAAGVHLIDTTIRAGVENGWMPLPELPMTPGREVAGVVDEVGPDVDPSWLGRRVVAHLGPASGGYAELAACDVAALHPLPDGLADDAAVAMIGTGRTTLGILEVARPAAEDVVLVMAAAGGIGSLAVQAALDAGATVVGAAGGPSKVEVVRRLGATVAVDYTEPDWSRAVREALAGREVTLVLDGVGGGLGAEALDLLGVGGRVVLYGGASGSQTEITTGDLYRRGITASVGIGPRLFRRPGGVRGLEERAIAAAAAGRLVPLVGQSFPLAKAAEAHRALESRATVGKTVLEP